MAINYFGDPDDKFGSFNNKIALQLSPNNFSAFLFGTNPDLDTGGQEDLVPWGTYIWQTTAKPFYISSTNVADTQTFFIIVLDENYNEVRTFATLNGQNGVQVIGPQGQTQFRRGILMFNITPIPETGTLGDVYLGTEASPVGGIPADANKVLRAGATEQQSNQAIYTVPAGRTALLTSILITMNRNSASGTATDIYLRTREIDRGPWRRRTEAGVQSNGSSILDYSPPIPVRFPEKTDIVLSAVTTANNTAVGGGFQVLTFSNTDLP